MKRRILILSGTQLSANPRVVKEADTLSEAGYSVEVVGGLFQAEMADGERSLRESKRWTHKMLVDASSASSRDRLEWLRLRLRRRIWRELFARAGLADPRQLGYLAPEMLAYALEYGADLTIVHNPPAIWVGAELIRRGRRVAVDMEDWYSEDLTPEEKIHFPAAALRQYERKALRGAEFSTTTSRCMTEALAAAYGCEPPKIVYNSFPWADRASIDGQHLDRRDLSVPSVHWFSQVIGPRRGLETLIDALPNIHVRCEIHLRGRMSPGYGEHLMQRAPEEWRARIHFHDQVPHSELISRTAEHDIGLALEIPHSRSKALTLANKLPLYLLAGLPVVASDTDGQREAAALAPDAVFLFAAGNAAALATVLDGLLTDPALRTAAREKAVAAAEEVFSWERSAQVIVAEVDRLFSRARDQSDLCSDSTVSAGSASSPRVRLGIVCTHPIQYHAPAFRALASRPDLEVMVFYEWERPAGSIDVEFDRETDWDVPLLGGYPHQFVPNVSTDPGTHQFGSIDNPTLVRTIESWKPDVLVVYGWAFRSHLRVLRAFHGRVPLVFRGDSTLLDERPGLRTFARRAWLRWVYHHVDLALYCGQLNKAYFEAHGLRPDQLRWSPHAVDNEAFASHDEERKASARDWRRRLGIGDDDLAFLFAGKLSLHKGPDTLLSAFIALNESAGSCAHLIFAGDGKLSETLRTKAEGHACVHFLGFQNQSMMPVIYRLGDVTVMPSVRETWGLAVNESFACGRPVIVSDRVGCAPDLVAGKGTGVMFEHGSVQGLTDAMTVLIHDPAKRMSMADAARKVIQGWTIEAYSERLASVAVELAAERARRAKAENASELNRFSKARDN